MSGFGLSTSLFNLAFFKLTTQCTFCLTFLATSSELAFQFANMSYLPFDHFFAFCKYGSS